MEYSFNKDLSFTFRIRGTLPKRAWSNILANDKFGFIATDAGTGHMWHLNSRENRINRWLNDPETTVGTERLLWREGDRTVSLFADNDGCDCDVTYGFGFARWDKRIDGKRFSVTAFVPPHFQGRILIIESGLSRGELLYFTDLVLGSDESSGPYIVTEHRDGMITAKNRVNREFKDSVFRTAASCDLTGFTCDRLSWESGETDGRVGAGMLPCIGMVMGLKERTVIVTGCESEGPIRACCSYDEAKKKLLETVGYWEKQVSPITVRTPDPVLDNYVNGWALYQVTACRLLARCSVYQCGGAFGFRDQLQDVTAALISSPELVRKHIIRAAEHQFEEGDVQHWWHPSFDGTDTDKGVRTRCSDDLLWLCYALSEYVSATGDTEFCKTEAGYISGPPLKPEEKERYFIPQKSRLKEPLTEHCIRACELVIERGVGAHGLCLMGSGDWNDGMNNVGIRGKGESVWLTWFASVVFRKTADLCREMKNASESERLMTFSEEYRAAAERAWDGSWFLRGYYDDGAPLGSKADRECAIDSIAQSFGVFAGGDSVKTGTALDSAYERLFDRENRVVRLFAPSFDEGEHSPGYIRGYAPGFRENGGQYTHGAVWLAKALIMSGDPDRGYEILNALLPDTHDNDVYKAEPYVIAADVSYNRENIGLAGWSWYTGAAGWYYRTVIEDLLGIRLKHGKLTVSPTLPKAWKGYSARVKYNGEITGIEVEDGNVKISAEAV